MYRIEYASKNVVSALKSLRAYERKQILNAIDKQLLHAPTIQTKHRKPIVGLTPPWDYEEPIWELSIGEYRVFYDVDEDAAVVRVRAIRHKPPHKTTEEIL
jgi:mRNA-degrading endonuclease RelE of RelBE toxin-antitoxin system